MIVSVHVCDITILFLEMNNHIGIYFIEYFEAKASLSFSVCTNRHFVNVINSNGKYIYFCICIKLLISYIKVKLNHDNTFLFSQDSHIDTNNNNT